MLYRSDVGWIRWYMTCVEKRGSNSCASLRRYIYTISRARNVNWDTTHISCLCIARENDIQVDIINHVDHLTLVATTCRYRFVTEIAVSTRFAWYFHDDWIIRGSQKRSNCHRGESRRTLRSSIQATGESKRENRGRWEFNISLIVSPLSNLAATAL